MGFIASVLLISLTTENLLAQDEEVARPYLYDAALHYVLSTELTFATCMFFTLQNPEMPLTKKYLLSAGVVTCIGFGKEFADLIDGNFDWSDIGFDLLGIGTGIVLHYFVFDKKMQRNNLSFNITGEVYMASLRLYF